MKPLFDDLDDADRALLRPASAAFVAPMLATLTEDRFTDPAWIFERKLDGVRAISVCRDTGASLWSRTEKPMDATYPELVDAVAAQIPADTVVDGEIVAFVGAQTSFERLQGRIGIHDPVAARATGIPVFLYLFDLLVLDGHDTTALPLRVRKRLLRDAVTFTDPLRMSSHRNGDGEAYLQEACQRGWRDWSANGPTRPTGPAAAPTTGSSSSACTSRSSWSAGGPIRTVPAPGSALCSSATTNVGMGEEACATRVRSAPASTTARSLASAPASATSLPTARRSPRP
jgi:ATP dependent DNA ligase domain